MTKLIISLSVEKELVEKVNSLRGLVSRSKFIEEIIKRGIENGTKITGST